MLECPICWEPFNVVENVPYVLWCGHTICKYCLLGLPRAVVIKSSGIPFQLPFFITCRWCNMVSMRLVCNGTIKFPSKNSYLLWMVESMNGCRSNKRVTSEQRDIEKRWDGLSNTASDVTRGYMRTGRLHGYICKSMALVAHLLAKFPLVVMFLVMALYAIPVSAAVLGVYFFVSIALAVPSFIVLYFAFPSLNWLPWSERFQLELWKEMKTEAPKWGLEGAKRSVAGAKRRPLMVLTMVSSVLFQEKTTCLLTVTPAPPTPPTVIPLVALPPYIVNPSTAHHLRAHAPRAVNAYLDIDQIIKL